MLITIHQPDMMPWLGFFNKIDKADKWVILDHTKNNPRVAAFWGRRVKILVNGEEKWLSLPLKKPESNGLIGIPINEIEYNVAEPKFFLDALKMIEFSYKRAPFFNDIFPLVESFLMSKEINMSKRNLSFIFQIMNLLQINTKVYYSSELNCQSSATELLVEIIQKLHGSSYLCGGGAAGYQKDFLFHDAGIDVIHNNFHHPLYKQLGNQNFVSGLSIIDALMNIGILGTKKLICNRTTN